MIPTAEESTTRRQTLSLSGMWQIAEGTLDQPPTLFDRTVPVPGLVDMATPSFVEPGPKVADREKPPSKDPRRDAFWYRRTFTVPGPLPAVATLKISKAMFGSCAFLNGTLLGNHPPSYTPGYFDARAALLGGENELLIRVGSDREAVTTAYPSGFDFERERYVPGIFDEVELILSGTPHILNIQTVPNIANKTVRVQTQLRNTGSETNARLTLVVREAESGRIVGRAETETGPLPTDEETTLDAQVHIDGCRLWSPDDPFLYALTVTTKTDCVETRFGMREFRFNSATRLPELNGKPYSMRGSNITLFRFFEDPDRGNLPWDEEWVRRLHRKAKDMHWNCLRYCIGFPPEAWYRIADEEGLLIQDEFPIWFGGADWSAWPEALKRDQLAIEYKEWIRERWNHPCVVAWSASNETASEETQPAIAAVRGLDLSNRPWGNSFTAPQQPGDTFESHPYHFMNSNFKLRDLATANVVPKGNYLDNDETHPVIINEYGWLWLNRDGTPTTLTKDLYRNLLGPDSTAEQRMEIYALYLAAETEFWRVHRKASAVMHFTMLGYCRPNGQTSDHWLDVLKLTWEPNFYKYVRDSFAPVCPCIKFWDDRVCAGEEAQISVTLINDLEEVWAGPVTLSIKQGDQVVAQTKRDGHVAAHGLRDLTFEITMPDEHGPYAVEAELNGADGQPVRSVRRTTCTGRLNAGFKSRWNGAPPGRTLRVEVGTDADGHLAWRIDRGQRQILGASQAGVVLDGVDTGATAEVGSPNVTEIDETFPWRGPETERRQHCRVAEFPVKAGDLEWTFELRAFDDGVAYRCRIPGTGKRHVSGESAAFDLPAGTICYVSTNTMNYEGVHVRSTVEAIEAADGIGMPMTVELPGGGYAAITEANIFGWSGMTLVPTGSTVVRSAFRCDPAGWDVDGDIVTPWRVVTVASDLNGLVHAPLVDALCPPPDPTLFPQGMQTPWIKTGRVLWQWWAFDDPGTHWSKQKGFVDKAVELHCECYLVDEGWENTRQEWYTAGDPAGPWPRMKELCDYAAERGVRIWVWRAWEYNEQYQWPGLETQEKRREFFRRFRETGIVGVKIDFMNSESRDRLAFYEDCLRIAAENQVMVNFHGAYKPTGELRTWPNEMTREGIRGLEHNKWSQNPPSHDATLPFTRLLAGHGDFTPTTFNAKFLMGTTFAHQLACAVVLTTPLLCWADDPDLYLASPAVDAIRTMPVLWDESRVLAPSRIGELAAFARRSGEEWWVGVLNGGDRRRVDLPTDFLGEGFWMADCYADGPEPVEFTVTHNVHVSPETPFTADLAAGGGVTLRIRKTIV